jgi:hypothetical protein
VTITFYRSIYRLPLRPQDNDKITGGLTLERYQDLYGDFLGNLSTEANPGCFLFGPLGSD